MARRGWWLALAGLIFLMSLGPSGAHSVREYLLGWAMGFLTAVVVIGVLVLFFRDNILAYVGGGFLLTVVTPMVSLLAQPPLFFVGNGIVLAVLILIFVGWMVTGRQYTSVALDTNGMAPASGPLAPSNPDNDRFAGTQ